MTNVKRDSLLWLVGNFFDPILIGSNLGSAKIALFSEIRSVSILPGSMAEPGEYTQRSGWNWADIPAEQNIICEMAIPHRNVRSFRGAKICHMAIIEPRMASFSSAENPHVMKELRNMPRNPSHVAVRPFWHSI